jgi:hypothetical protein
MSEEATSVIIIGGGIVGLSAALFLQHHNVPFILFERHSSTSIHPRARGINARTMEMYREVGIEKEIQEVGAKRKQEAGIISASTLAEALADFDGGMAKAMMGSMVGKLETFTPCKGMTRTQYIAFLRSCVCVFVFVCARSPPHVPLSLHITNFFQTQIKL